MENGISFFLSLSYVTLKNLSTQLLKSKTMEGCYKILKSIEFFTATNFDDPNELVNSAKNLKINWEELQSIVLSNKINTEGIPLNKIKSPINSISESTAVSNDQSNDKSLNNSPAKRFLYSNKKVTENHPIEIKQAECDIIETETDFHNVLSPKYTSETVTSMNNRYNNSNKKLSI